MKYSESGFSTRAIHAGQEPDPATGATIVPIYQTSTYAQRSPGDNKGYEYSRTHNPTRTQLQDALAALDNGRHGLAFASGMAAIDCVLRLLKPGDEVISTDDLYGGSYRIMTKVYEPLGIKFHFVPMGDMTAVRAKVSAHTKLIWVETPTNPLLNVIDIAAAAAVAKEAGALLAVLSRPVVALRARRRGRAADRRLRAAVDAVAEEDVLGPMADVREDAARFRTAVAAARR